MKIPFKSFSIILSLILLGFSSICVAQNYSIRTYTSSEIAKPPIIKTVEGNQIPEALEGRIIMAAEMKNSGPLGNAIWVMCMDKCGVVIWSQEVRHNIMTLSLSDLTIGRFGEIVLGGVTLEDFGDPFVIKMTPDGEVSAMKVFGIPDADFVYSIGTYPNGNYFIYGNTHNGSATSRNFSLTLDQDFNFLRGNKYADVPIWGYTISTADGGLLARTGNHIYKTDSLGQIVWSNTYLESNYYSTVPIEVADGYIYGRYRMDVNKTNDASFYKLNKDGSVAWTSKGSESIWLSAPIELDNGNLLFLGKGINDTIDNVQMHSKLYEINATGDILNEWIISAGDDLILDAKSLSKSSGAVFISAMSTNVIDQTEYPVLINLWQNDLGAGCGLISIKTERLVNPVSNQPFTFNTEPLSILQLDQNYEVKKVATVSNVICEKVVEHDLDIGNDTVICIGESLLLQANNNGYDHYLWSNNSTINETVVHENGWHWLKATIGCITNYDSMYLSYFPPIELQFSVNPKQVNPFEFVSFRSFTKNAVDTYWIIDGVQVETDNFNLKFNEHGKHSVVYISVDSNGCINSDTSQVIVSFFSVYIPNSVTPNNDDLNDSFEPMGFGIIRFEMDIYNRHGNLIYRSDQAWDGKVEDRVVPFGQYVYQVEIFDDQDNAHTYSGVLEVIR